MSFKRHVLQVVALVTAVALVFGAFAGSASAKKLTKKQKASIRAELRKQVKKNPGAVKRRSFLKRAALVNFKLPVTIRLRNPCTGENGQNPFPTTGGNPSQAALSQNCLTQGTALNQRTVPSANVNLGPSLGTRSVAIGGALAAVVEFQDTYDGGALGNVNLKILPSDKTLTTSSVPLLWNHDITDPATRSEKNFASANSVTGASFAALNGAFNAYIGRQGCGDWATGAGGSGYAAQSAPYSAPVGYKALFWGVPYDFGLGTGAGLPGYPEYDGTGVQNGVYLGRFTGVDDPNNIQAGGVTGNNDWIGTNPFPFPTGSVPGTGTGTVGGSPSTYGGAPDTVLRTNALSLGIAPGGVSVNMSTGTQSGATAGGLTSAQGSQDITLGYSGGQANLFGNIPGKNVGIDVTVNLATKINSIVRILDQDLFKNKGTIEGEDLPAGLFNCRQIFTGAVQNYIPGVRLTGSLRIAPAITKDGKVRIAKATVSSAEGSPDRVALSACLVPAKPYLKYQDGGSTASGMPFGGWTDSTPTKFPTMNQATNGGLVYGPGGVSPGLVVPDGNTSLPLISSERRYPNLAEGNAPSTVKCNADGVPQMAEVIRRSGLTGTVSGLPDPTDSAFAGINYNGSQASVAGDITVNPIDVDVLLGDQPVGT